MNQIFAMIHDTQDALYHESLICTHTFSNITVWYRSTLAVTKSRNTELHSQQLTNEEELTTLRLKLSEAEHRCKQELQAMRERHRLKFNDSTSKLRTQCKALAKRVVVLEAQLSKNSVSKLFYVCVCVVCVCVCIVCTVICFIFIVEYISYAKLYKNIFNIISPSGGKNRKRMR